MRTLIILSLAAFLSNVAVVFSQVPSESAVRILAAEDARSFNSELITLMRSKDAAIRARAALAAGRIGRKEAIPHLAALTKDPNENVRATATFALGEIESTEAADALLAAIEKETALAVKARLVEAIGKVAAANPKADSAAKIKNAIVSALESELAKGEKCDRQTVLLGLTALIRTRPDGADALAVKFLNDKDARVRADAANTLTRLRSKNASAALIALVKNEADPIARANAARALGAAGAKEALDLLVSLMTKDADSRVRISAVRSLSSLKDKTAGEKVVERGNDLLKRAIDKGLVSRRVGLPTELTELLEIATAVGNIFAETSDEKAIQFLRALRDFDHYRSSETERAFALIAPEVYVQEKAAAETFTDFHATSAYLAGLAAIADTKNTKATREAGKVLNAYMTDMPLMVTDAEKRKELKKAFPDAIVAASALKIENLEDILLGQLVYDDVFVRAAVANALSELPKSDKIVSALEVAFGAALSSDRHEDDAQLAILDALAKLDRQAAIPTFSLALSSPDYLVRKKAFDILDDESVKKDAKLETFLKNAREKHLDEVRPYAPDAGTKLGQVLNRRADYIRALSRKNGSATAILTTEKGVFEIELLGEDAPLTVDNFIKLANSGYFNGIEVHRVVANFVMQDGDPRGDGNGGPGWSIRCEINMQPYDRGAVGMALSGKDTGGSQWFVTHSPQPHLDGGYTVFGRVKGTGMDVVDGIVRGDKILNVKIAEKR